ncbi:MAG: putative acetyltransferase [Planctomycetota bacterium]|jgi:putative acetyltransferase
MSSPDTLPTWPEERIRKLRATARRLVRALGVMHNGNLEGLDCTPSQCHVLIELAERGRQTTGELAVLLEVDKSTASRTLRPLLEKGLVEALSDPNDQRTKPIRLTDAGRECLAKVHAFGDQQVQSALAQLDEEQRAAVLRGLDLYEGALRRAKGQAGVSFRPLESRDEHELDDLLQPGTGAIGELLGTGHAFFVAEREGQLIAAAGIAPLADDLCEVRHLHVLPSARSAGLGRRMLELCLDAARKAGYPQCCLGTLRHMHHARALGEGAGFRASDPAPKGCAERALDSWQLLDL